MDTVRTLDITSTVTHLTVACGGPILLLGLAILTSAVLAALLPQAADSVGAIGAVTRPVHGRGRPPVRGERPQPLQDGSVARAAAEVPLHPTQTIALHIWISILPGSMSPPSPWTGAGCS